MSIVIDQTWCTFLLTVFDCYSWFFHCEWVGLKQNVKWTLCVATWVWMSPPVSIYLFTCKYRYDISHLVLIIKALSCKISFTFYYISWGYITFCSNEPHFGHWVNYYASKYIAEHILKHSEFLFIRHTIKNSRYSFSQKSHFMRNEI